MSNQHSPQKREERWPEVWLVRDPTSSHLDSGWRDVRLERPERLELHLGTERYVPAAALQDREAELEKAETDGMLAILETRERLAEEEARANRAEAALREAREEILSRAEAEDELRLKSRADNDSLGAVAHACSRDAHREDAKLLDTSIGDREPEKCGGSGEIRNPGASAFDSRCPCPGCPACKPPQSPRLNQGTK